MINCKTLVLRWSTVVDWTAVKFACRCEMNERVACRRFDCDDYGQNQVITRWVSCAVVCRSCPDHLICVPNLLRPEMSTQKGQAVFIFQFPLNTWKAVQCFSSLLLILLISLMSQSVSQSATVMSIIIIIPIKSTFLCTLPSMPDLLCFPASNLLILIALLIPLHDSCSFYSPASSSAVPAPQASSFPLHPFIIPLDFAAN